VTATLTIRLERPTRHEPPPVVGRVPRIARLLAFAHKLEADVRAGVYEDLADAARKLGLTRARVTQIANLALLAPPIQEKILAMAPVTAGRDPLNERTLRPIVSEPIWERQIAMLRVLAAGMENRAGVGARIPQIHA
jgi:hypothetical protein